MAKLYYQITITKRTISTDFYCTQTKKPLKLFVPIFIRRQQDTFYCLDILEPYFWYRHEIVPLDLGIAYLHPRQSATISPIPLLSNVSQTIFAGKTAQSTKGVLLGMGTKAEFEKYSDRSASFILWFDLVLKFKSLFLQEPATVLEEISISDLPLGE